jgi:4a-hydroxytetrahydrobiopterin dehydratase
MTTCDLDNKLGNKKCIPCEGGVAALTAKEIAVFLPNLNDWQVSPDHKSIRKQFSFKNFYHTMAFANAIAYIANKENHHPDLKLGYNYCEVLFTTHAINGLSENDFICAAKIDLLG